MVHVHPGWVGLCCVIGLGLSTSAVVHDGPGMGLLDDNHLGEAAPTGNGAPLPSNDATESRTADEKSASEVAVATTAAKSAQVVSMETEQKKSNSERLLLKPPGCRPTTEKELFNYYTMRTKCATHRAGPSAFTKPSTQTPIKVRITDVRITSMTDNKKQFAMEMTRAFEWSDPAALKNDPSKLWNPRLMFSFINSVKVEDRSHIDLVSEGTKLTLTEHVRVTLTNPWDFSKFPLDQRTFNAQIWSGSGTEMLEPVIVEMDEIELPEDLFGFTPSSKLVATVSPWGEPLGPEGVWGKSQMIQLQATAIRNPSVGIVTMLLPVTLCTAIAYTGFYLKVAQLMPRLALSVLSFLILSTYMRVITTSIPTRSYLVWMEYWLTFQAVIVAIACCHHSVAHFMNEKSGEAKSVNLDMAMRIVFPVTYILTYCWAESIVVWGFFGIIFNITSMVLMVLFFFVIFAALERRSTVRHEKTHYPGI